MAKCFYVFFDRICVAAGAMLFMQAPLFIHQYIQQLTGREAELHLQIDAMQNAAKLSGKTLEQFIQKFLSSTDPDFVLQGELMQAMTTRWNHLLDAILAFQNSSVWERPFIFATHFHADIAKSTLHQFSVGLPLNLEGACYALVGGILGYCFFNILQKAAKRLFCLFKKKESPSAADSQ